MNRFLKIYWSGVLLSLLKTDQMIKHMVKWSNDQMVKHTQTIRRQQPTNCLSVFDHLMSIITLSKIKFFFYC